MEKLYLLSNILNMLFEKKKKLKKWIHFSQIIWSHFPQENRGKLN